MRETSFIKKNREKWVRYENLSKGAVQDPEELSRFFIEVTDDLSYARTFYPNRSVRTYLNGIARRAFQNIYKYKKHDIGRRFSEFWKTDIPKASWEIRYDLWIGFTVFIISTLIGVISTHYDTDFPKYILGERYIQMTEENIAQGDPMGVYKSPDAFDMFIRIAFNNLRIDFIMFALGALFSVGTIFITLYNGIMLGTFQYYFKLKGLLLTTALTIWLHGTFEMGAMVINAGAGIAMGRGLIFPGNYRRLQSFQLSAWRAFKVFISVLPFTFIAAIIETWITRHTEAPDWIKLVIILLSFFIVTGYYFILPYWLNKKGKFQSDEDNFALPPEQVHKPEVTILKSNDKIFKDLFWYIKNNFTFIVKTACLAGFIFALSGFLFFRSDLTERATTDIYRYLFQLFDYEENKLLMIPEVIIITYILFSAYSSIYFSAHNTKLSYRSKFRSIITSFVFTMALVMVFSINYMTGIQVFLLFMPLALFVFVNFAGLQKGIIQQPFRSFYLIFTNFQKFTGMALIIYIVNFFIYLAVMTIFSYLVMQLLKTNLPVEDSFMEIFQLVYTGFIFYFVLTIVFFIWIYTMFFMYYSLEEIYTASELRKRISLITLNKPF